MPSHPLTLQVNVEMVCIKKRGESPNTLYLNRLVKWKAFYYVLSNLLCYRVVHDNDAKLQKFIQTSPSLGFFNCFNFLPLDFTDYSSFQNVFYVPVQTASPILLIIEMEPHYAERLFVGYLFYFCNG